MELKNNRHIPWSIRLTIEIKTQLEFLVETLPDCPDKSELARQVLEQGLDMIIEKNNLNAAYRTYKKAINKVGYK